MKMTLLTLILFIAVPSQAQYKDSLKTFRKLTKSFQKSSDFVFIPSGAYTRGSNDSDLPSSDLNRYYLRALTVSVDSFFMQKFEVSNAHYLEFVNHKMKEDRTLGKSLLPDTLVWRARNVINSPYVDYYFRHPAYSNYPVVGISYVQAVAYAEWKTEQYNLDQERTFKKVIFRIPTEEEWEFACKGGCKYGYLPWCTRATHNEKEEPLANFQMINQFSVYRDSVEEKTYDGKMVKKRIIVSSGEPLWYPLNAGSLYDTELTSPVNSLEPNGYGLYNMAGNVEELVDSYYFRDPSVYEFSQDQSPNMDQDPWGVTKGGSWYDTGYYLQYPVRQFYENQNSSSNEIGFRLVMEVLEY